MPSKNNLKKTRTSRSANTFIHCECGFSILLVSDSKAMGKSIQDHAVEHSKKERNPGKAAFEETRIQNQLILQTIEKTTS